MRVEESEGITTIILDDLSSRNSLSWEMVQELSETIEGARRSRALILSNFPPVFSAGGSLDDLLKPKAPLEDMYRVFRVLDEAPMPTVAAVDGAAIGAGINLALCCDVALCTPRSKFDARFLDVGIHPGGGHLWRLSRTVGRQGAAALTLFGEVLDGHEAERRGLVWRCVDEDSLSIEALRMARRAAARDPQLMVRAKRTLNAASAIDNPADAITLEFESQRWSMEQPTFFESMQTLRDRIGRNAK